MSKFVAETILLSDMEKRIKAIYIITIAAILAILCMQGWWLWRQYTYTLSAQAEENQNEIMAVVNDYTQIRNHRTSTKDSIAGISNEYKRDSVKWSVDFMIIKRSIRDLLHLPASHQVTNADIKKASLVLATKPLSLQEINADTIKRSYSFSLETKESLAMDWVKSASLDILSPFTQEGMDSILAKCGIVADVTLAKSDTIEWEPYHKISYSLSNPTITYFVPYSPLERNVAIFKQNVPVLDTLKSMAGMLAVTLLLSILLVACLCWQFSTILKQSRIDRLRNTFVHTMIHELKRPLSTMMMCASALDNESMMADKVFRKKVVLDFRNSLGNLSAYFSKLRDITFNETGQIALSVSRFGLVQFVDEQISRATIPSAKSVHFENLCKDCTISADRIHLANILSNLFENAIKYSGAEVTVSVDGYIDGGNLIIKVQDNGIGINASDKSHLFDKFFRSQEAINSGQPGIGLGLAYVKQLVEAHGGSVAVESEMGAGTTFTLTIPQS